MPINFETLMRQALAEGMSLDDIDTQYNTVWDSLYDEEEARKKQEDTRVENILDKYLEEVDPNTDKVTPRDVAIFALVAVLPDHKDWTEDKIDYYLKTVEETIVTLADNVNLVQELEQELMGLGKKMEKAHSFWNGLVDEKKVSDFLDKLGI